MAESCLDEIRCGDIIEAMQGDDWITGRYEADLNGSLPEPKVLLVLIDQQHTIKLETACQFVGRLFFAYNTARIREEKAAGETA